MTFLGKSYMAHTFVIGISLKCQFVKLKFIQQDRKFHQLKGKVPYLEIPKILNVIEVLNILLITEIPQDVNIAICSFISCEDIMIRNNNNLFTIPDLQIANRKQ